MKCLAVGNAKFKYLNRDVANYDMNGVSAIKDEKLINQRKDEELSLRNELFSNRLNDFFYSQDKKTVI